MTTSHGHPPLLICAVAGPPNLLRKPRMAGSSHGGTGWSWGPSERRGAHASTVGRQPRAHDARAIYVGRVVGTLTGRDFLGQIWANRPQKTSTIQNSRQHWHGV